MNRAVIKRYHQLSARSSPRVFCLPCVDVLTAAKAKTATSSVDCFNHINTRVAGVAIQRNSVWITCCEDIQAFVSAQAEFNWDCLAGVYAVQSRCVAYRREEAGKVIEHLNRKRTRRSVAACIGCGCCHRCRTDGENRTRCNAVTDSRSRAVVVRRRRRVTHSHARVC